MLSSTAPPSVDVPDWRTWELEEGILTEPIALSGRVALWLPAERREGSCVWERVAMAESTGFVVSPGIRAAAVATVRVRQRSGGWLGRWFRRASEHSWLIPNGQTGEQQGTRRTDMLLVWSEQAGPSLEEHALKARWPESERVCRLGKDLYLVTGVRRPAAPGGESPGPPEVHDRIPPEADCARTREVAERLLAEARKARNRSQEASALADLGAVALHEGKAEEAVATLGEALRVARELGDVSRETDILGNLGVLTMAAGHPGRAREIFEMTLAGARKAGDRFAEKLALERVGLASARLNEPALALEAFEQALAVARAVGHRKHEAELLWSAAIACAELDRRAEAVSHGQAAVDLLEQMGNPQAAWFADYLRKYRAGETLAGSPEGEDAGAGTPTLLGNSLAAGMWASPGGAAPGRAQRGPGLLRMAVSSTRSMAQFVGSGFQTVTAPTLAQRLQTCAACEHYTGLRCRLCGCFISAKARLPHEDCPAGKWAG